MPKLDFKIETTRTININDLPSIQEENKPEIHISTKGILANLKNKEQKPEKNRFYLPVLSINDPSMYPSQPLENRLHLTDKVAEEVCLNNCCGVQGVSAACCKLDPENLEHVLGPLDEEYIEATLKWIKKYNIIPMRREDIVIDFEEGKIIGETLFANSPQREVFQRKETYPILRFKVDGPRYSCIFLNSETNRCNIYKNRSNMCKFYYCSYIKANFLIRTPQNPNTFKKIF